METNALERLLKAIEYPVEALPDARSFTLSVDGGEMTLSARDGRLMLSKVLRRPDGEPVDLATLAGYAAGRMLREEAVLAWDPDLESPILWQDVSADVGAAVLIRFFEVFATSCEWWMARLGEAQVADRVPEMMIRP